MMQSSADNFDVARNAADITLIGMAVVTMMDWLPTIAAVLTVLWLVVRLLNEVLVTVARSRALKRPRTDD